MENCRIGALKSFVLPKRGSIRSPVRTFQIKYGLLDVDRTMVVAMIAARTVQMSTNQIVGVIAVRYAFVSASSTVLVSLVMRRAVVGWRA